MTDRPRTACPKCGELKTAQGMPGHLKSHASTEPKPKNRRGRPRKNEGSSSWSSRHLNDYLKSIDAGKNQVSKSVQSRIDSVNERIVAAQQSGQFLRAVKLTQTRTELEQLAVGSNLQDLFIQEAKAYSEEHGITYKAWREFNVPAKVLKEAGITK